MIIEILLLGILVLEAGIFWILRNPRERGDPQKQRFYPANTRSEILSWQPPESGEQKAFNKIIKKIIK